MCALTEHIRVESSLSALSLSLTHLFFLLCFLSLSMAISLTGNNMSAFLGLFVGLALVGLASSAKFDELFQPSWALDHFTYEGELLKLKLDNYSGKLTKSERNFFLLYCSIHLYELFFLTARTI